MFGSRLSVPPHPGPGPSPTASWPAPTYFPKPTLHPQGGMSPSLPAAGMVTQLPLNLGKEVEDRVSCSDSSLP